MNDLGSNPVDGNADAAVLVTGASGFIGAAVRRALEGRGTPVVAIDAVAGGDPDRPVILCDITDLDRLRAVAANRPLCAILHCGALSGPMVAFDDPLAMVRVNVLGAAHVLEIARLNGAPRFVYCSSGAVYGNTEGAPEGLISEDALLAPTNVYGASKVATEQLVHAYSRQFGIDGVSLRLAWGYGPRRTTPCLIRTMIEDAMAGRPTNVPFGADHFRQYVHIDDIVSALLRALDTPHLPRTAYNITGASHVTLNEVADAVRAALPGADIRFGSGPDPVDNLQGRHDIGPAERELGFVPSVSLRDGVRSYAGWIGERGGARAPAQ